MQIYKDKWQQRLSGRKRLSGSTVAFRAISRTLTHTYAHILTHTHTHAHTHTHTQTLT